MTVDLSSALNQSACPNCIPPAYQINGYDYLFKGDYSGFIQQYGWQVVVAGVLSFIIVHYFNAALIEYYRRKKNEDHNR